MTSGDLSLIGIWLLVLGAVAILIEGAVAGMWTARLVRRSRRLSAQVVADRRLVEADVERLRAALAETQTLWRPYGRALRYLRHPLVAALLESYMRRRSRAR